MSAPTDEAFLARTRSEGPVSALVVECRSRPFADIDHGFLLLRCSPAKRPLVVNLTDKALDGEEYVVTAQNL
jgi:hypothetical protein